jgi:HD superfamily phosphohydrolase
MDYLLRDSYHAGVAYGRFDHYRLIDTLRILPPPVRDAKNDDRAPELGVEEGGIYSAEALMLARYFMYSQLYYHQIRCIYNIHLMDFLRAWLPNGKFDTTIDGHLALTDNEVTAAIASVARNSDHKAHDPARRIAQRNHFRRVYERNPDDNKLNPQAGRFIYDFLSQELGASLIRRADKYAKGGAPDFPVKMHDGRIVSSTSRSETLSRISPLAILFMRIRALQRRRRR